MEREAYTPIYVKAALITWRATKRRGFTMMMTHGCLFETRLCSRKTSSVSDKSHCVRTPNGTRKPREEMNILFCFKLLRPEGRIGLRQRQTTAHAASVIEACICVSTLRTFPGDLPPLLTCQHLGRIWLRVNGVGTLQLSAAGMQCNWRYRRVQRELTKGFTPFSRMSSSFFGQSRAVRLTPEEILSL